MAQARFADSISFFLNIPWKWNNLVSLRPNYFIFIGYWKTGGREGFRVNPLNLLIRHNTTKVCFLMIQHHSSWASSLWHRQVTKTQMSLQICIVWQEPSLLVYINKSCRKWNLVSLNSCKYMSKALCTWENVVTLILPMDLPNYQTDSD